VNAVRLTAAAAKDQAREARNASRGARGLPIGRAAEPLLNLPERLVDEDSQRFVAPLHVFSGDAGARQSSSRSPVEMHLADVEANAAGEDRIQ
jgi:hypothetical protein